LLQQGATIVTTIDDLRLAARLTGRPAISAATHSSGGAAIASPAPAPRTADPNAAAVVRAVEAGAGDIIALERHTKLAARELTVALASLELAGVVVTDHAGGVRLAYLSGS
jgi:predicted Rossmann fold nucleotide-binding protein DprA/Smf involved in DNA uptake